MTRAPYTASSRYKSRSAVLLSVYSPFVTFHTSCVFPSHDNGLLTIVDADVVFDFDCPFEDIVASDPLSNFGQSR